MRSGSSAVAGLSAEECEGEVGSQAVNPFSPGVSHWLSNS